MDDSNLEENALRELREETGYVGTIDKSTFTQFPPPTVYGDPWKSNESAKLVFVEVDEGQTPLQ
jgi:8-oxo-dGTP pyrophosphatase MutT (NUDIX family)